MCRCFGHKPWVWGLLIWSVLLFFSCSKQVSSGDGNSAETGNPKIAGSFTLWDGRPAASAQVQCIPAGFNGLTDTLAKSHTTVTDSLGHFHFDSLPVGTYTLEANHFSGLKLLMTAVSVSKRGNIIATGVLSEPATLRISASSVPDGTLGHVVIKGTSIARKTVAKFGSFFVDSLPPGKLDSVLFYQKSSDPVFLGSSIQLLSGQTAKVNTPSLSLELKISLATDAKGIDLNSNLLGFPLLIRLDSSRVDFDAIDSTTPLLVFLVDSTKALPFHITRWNRVQKQAEIWVRMDTLYAQEAAQSITLRWDESQDFPSPTGKPFSSKDGYLAAWHFDQGSNEFRDAGEFGFDGNPIKVKDTMGSVGGGLWFDGKSSYVSIPGSTVGPLDITSADTITVSIWAHLSQANTSRFVFGKGASQFHLKYQYPSGWLYELRDAASLSERTWGLVPFDTTSDKDKWAYLSVVQRGASMQIYKDGEIVVDSETQGSSSENKYMESTFEIGRRLNADASFDQFFSGILDELHFSRVPRSAEWIRASYENQKPEGYWP